MAVSRRVGSLGIALIASLWLIERSLDVAIFY
jgi:hypothetical protein